MNQNAKTKRPFPYVAVCLIVIAVLVCAVLVFHLLDSTGVVGKMDKVVVSTNYSVNANELAVYEYQAALSGLANQFWYYQYGLMQDTAGVTKVFSNAYDYAYYMLPNAMAQGTYKAQAYEYARQYVVYCEGAKEAKQDVALKDEIKTELDTYMNDLKTTAESGNMNLNTFIKTYIGKGVSKGDVESAMEKYILGYKYAEIKSEELSDAVTETELKEYLENNKDLFYKNYYTSYTLVNGEKLKDKAAKCKTVEELKVVLAEYKVNEMFEDLYKKNIEDAKIEDPYDKETTKKMMLESLLGDLNIDKDLAQAVLSNALLNEDPTAKDETTDKEEGTETETETETTEPETDAPKAAEEAEAESETEAESEAESEAETETGDKEDDKEEPKAEKCKKYFSTAGTTDFSKKANTIFTSIKSSLNSEINKINSEASASYVDLSDEEAAAKATAIQKELFKTGKKVGDFGVAEDVKEATETTPKTTTYTWYLITKTMVLDEEKTRDVYLATLTDPKKTDGTDTTAAETTAAEADTRTGKEKAEEFFKKLEADKTPENFDKLALEYGLVSEGGTALKSNVTEKSATATAKVYAEWLYSNDRAKGDIQILNNGTTYYVVLFEEINEETWKITARQNVSGEHLQTWFDEMVAKYSVEVDTAAPETAAGTVDEHAGHNH